MFEGKLTFGKYKGQTISSIVKNDTMYLDWCQMKNLITFSKEEQKVIHFLIDAQELDHQDKTYGFDITSKEDM